MKRKTTLNKLVTGWLNENFGHYSTETKKRAIACAKKRVSKDYEEKEIAMILTWEFTPCG